MFGKSVVVIVMCGLLFFGITDKALADAASELEQADGLCTRANVAGGKESNTFGIS